VGGNIATVLLGLLCFDASERSILLQPLQSVLPRKKGDVGELR